MLPNTYFARRFFFFFIPIFNSKMYIFMNEHFIFLIYYTIFFEENGRMVEKMNE